MKSTWPIALKHVLKYEGGYVNHPLDPGGATNFGIIQRTYDAWNKKHFKPLQDVRHISQEEVASIYQTEYWIPVGCEDLPAGFDMCVFDAAVNCGVGRARGWIIRVDTDLQQWKPQPKILEYMRIRKEYYRKRPHFQTFGKGWFNRCDQVQALCLSLIKEARNGCI